MARYSRHGFQCILIQWGDGNEQNEDGFGRPVMTIPATSLFVNRLHGLTRIAVIRHDRLIHLGLHREDETGLPGDMFLGKVTKVITGINAAFLDLGQGRSAFLNRADIPLPISKTSQADMASILKPGRLLPVQVKRAASGEKLMQVTAELKLVGFSGILVLGGKGISFSKRFKGEKQAEPFEALLHGKGELGYIVRSSASGLNKDQRLAELDRLLKDHDRLQEVIRDTGKPGLLRSLCPVKACLTDYWGDGLRSVFFDDEALYEAYRNEISQSRPDLAPVLKLHSEPYPMFDLYKIESEIQKASASRVWLKSGGFFDIRHTEALVAIDVNSGRDVKSGEGRSSGMRVNLEAAAEIGRQARVRNLAGLVVVDFINGKGPSWRKQLDDALKKAFRGDPARTDLLPVNHLGLAQISRERLGPDLNSLLRDKCGVCQGVGWVKSAETVAQECELQLTRELIGTDAQSVEITCGRRLKEAMTEDRIQAWQERFGVMLTVKAGKGMSVLGFEISLLD